MPKTIHTATYKDQTFTRTSASRQYAHVVIARRSYDHALEQARKGPLHGRENFEYWLRQLDAPTPRKTWETMPEYLERVERDQEAARSKLGDATSLEDFLARETAAMVARVEGQREAGLFDRFEAVGWCSRDDLAQKLHASTRAKPYFAEVVTLDVVRIVKGA